MQLYKNHGVYFFLCYVESERAPSIPPKIPDILFGTSNGTNHFDLVIWSDRNIRDQLWRWSTLTGPVISVGRTEMSLSIWQNCCSQYLFFVSFLQELSNAPWLGSCLCNWNVPFHWTLKTFDTECKYGGPLGRPGSSCAKARLVRPQEFCFDCAS